MRKVLIALWGLIACRRDPVTVDDTAHATSCLQVTTNQQATPVGIKTDEDGCGELVLGAFQIHGEGDLDLELFSDGIQVIPAIRAGAGGGVFEGLSMQGPFTLAGDAPLSVWTLGYASNDLSGLAPAGIVTLDGDGLPLLGGDDGASSAPPGVSWWAGWVGRADGASLLVGAHTARQTSLAVAFGDDGVAHVVWGLRGESVTVPAGQTLYLDALYTAIGPDPAVLMRGWAEAAAAAVGAVTSTEPLPTTWSTSGLGANPTEADLETRLVDLAQDPLLSPIAHVLVAEGWADNVGDWTAGQGFPSGLDALRARIETAGASAGIAASPLAVALDSATFADHPDWWVRDAGGEVLLHDGFAVLDVTRAEAAAWLDTQVAALVGAGFVQLELDHLAAGARRGTRATDLSALAAYQVALTRIRAAAGPDVWLSAADAPLLPSLGSCDGLRVGGDGDTVAAALGSTTRRGFLQGAGLWAEPPGLSVAGPDATARVVAHAASGGSLRLIDDLSGLDSAARTLALQSPTVDASGEAADPSDRFDDGSAVTLVFSAGWIGLVNGGDAPVELDGPGGTDLLTGTSAPPGPRTIAPGQGELWAPAPR